MTTIDGTLSTPIDDKKGLRWSLTHFAADIKLAHSVFALPFAASAIPFLETDTLKRINGLKIALLLICMVAARSFAMGINRFLDRHIDRENPRTKGRAIPAGRLSPKMSLTILVFAAAVFIAAARSLSPLAGWLALPLLAILAGYSLGKRFTTLVHWYLGLCLGFAPVAVQVALEGRISIPVAFLGMAVSLWTAGFDILYSLQDLVFDRAKNLWSVPSRFGVTNALWLSRLCFAGMIGLLTAVGVVTNRGWIYGLGIAICGAILAIEHGLVRNTDANGKCDKINAAFFNWNAAVSIIFSIFNFADWLMRS